MAGPKVTLTFDGDSSRLEAAIERVSSSSSRLQRRMNAFAKGTLGFWGALGGGAAAVGGATAALGSLGLMGISTSLALSGVSDAVKEYDKAMEDGKGMEKYEKKMATLTLSQQEFVRSLIAIKPQLKGLKETAASGMLPGFADAITGAISLLPVLNSTIGMTAGIMGQTATDLGNLFRTDRFQKNLDTFLSSTGVVTESIGNLVVSATDKIVEFGAKMAPVSEGVANFIDSVSIGFQGFLDNLTPYASSFTSIWESLGLILQILLPIVASVAGTFASQLAPVLQTIAGFLSENRGFVEWFLSNLPMLVVAFMGLQKVIGIFNAIRTAIMGIQLLLMANPWMAAVMVVVAIAALIIMHWDTIKAAIGAAWNWIKSTAISVWNSILGFFRSIWQSITGAFRSGVDGARNAFQSLVGWIRGVPGMILGALGNLGSLLVNSGRSLISGLWNGISSMVGWLVSKVSGVLSSIRNLFPFSPAKEGPFSGHGYTTYSGKALATDFGKGIESGIPNALSSIDSLMGAANMQFQGSVSMGGGATPVASGPTNLSVNFTGNVDSAFATYFMKLVRAGQIQVVAA